MLLARRPRRRLPLLFGLRRVLRREAGQSSHHVAEMDIDLKWPARFALVLVHFQPFLLRYGLHGSPPCCCLRSSPRLAMERHRKYGGRRGSGSSPSSSQPEQSQSSQPQRRVASASSSSSKTTTNKQHIRNNDTRYLDDEDEDDDSSEHHDEGEEYEDSFDKPAIKKRSKKASAPSSSSRSNSSNSARQRRAASVSSNPPSTPPKQKPKGIKLPDRVADPSAQHAIKRAKTIEPSTKSAPPTFSSDEEATPRRVGRSKPPSGDDDDEDEPPARKKRPPAGPSRSASRLGNNAPSTASILKIADAAQATKSSLRSIPDADAQAKRTASRDPFDVPDGRRGMVRNISKDSPFASGNEDAAQKLAEPPERKTKLAMQIPTKDIIGGGGGGGDSPRCSGDSLFPASSIASDASTSATSPLPPGPSDAEIKRMLMKASKAKTMLKLPPKEATTATGLAGRTAASSGDVPRSVGDLKVCPFCEQPMPRKPSPELVEMMQPYLDKWHQGRTLKATETLAACTKHQEEFEVIPNGKKQGWITTLDVSELGRRIEDEEEGHRSRVEEVLQRPQESEFWDVALRIREERRGRGKGRRGEIEDAQAGEGSASASAASAGWMAQMNEVQAGYYGEQGFDCIRGTLAKWLLLSGTAPTTNVDDETDDESPAPPPLSLKTPSALALIHPLTAVEFVDYVLVPEVACSLITYDYGHPKTHRYGAGKREKPRDLSMPEAREIKRQSTAYGNAMFPADAGGRGESLFDVGSAQRDAEASKTAIAGPSKTTNGNGKRVASQPSNSASTSTARRRRGQTSDSDSILDTPSSSKSTTSSSKRTPIADSGATSSRPRPRPQAAGAAAGPSASPSANGHRSYTARFFDDDDDEELGKSQTPKAGSRTGAGANASAPIDLTTPSPASGKRPRPKPRTSSGAPQRPVIRASDADEDVGNATVVVRDEEEDDDDDDFFSKKGKMTRRPRVSDAAAGGFSSDGCGRDSTVVQGKKAITTATTSATSSPRTPSSLRRASGQQREASAQQQQQEGDASDTNDVDSLAASQGSVVVLINNNGLTAANPAASDTESQNHESQREAGPPKPSTSRLDSSSLSSLSSSSSQMSSYDWPTTPPPPRHPLPPAAAAASSSSSHSHQHESLPHPLSQEQSIDELQSSPIQPQQQEQEETSPRRSRRLSQQGSPQQSPGQQQGRRRKRTATGERLSSPSWAAVDADESMDLDLGVG